MITVVLVFSVLSVGFALWFVARRSTSRSSSISGYLLLHDELSGWRAHSARYTDTGIVSDGVTYPATLPSLSVGSIRVWICTVSAPALVEHQALERAREAAALSSLWRGGGQWLDYLRVAGVVLPAIFSWLVYSRLEAIFPLFAEILSRLPEK